MKILRSCFLLAACAGASAAPIAHAQTNPALKPGLWQIHIDSEVDGHKPPDMNERTKNMSPEARQRMEAAMRERGITAGDSRGRKICHTRQTIESSGWADQQSGCKTDFSTRSATSWKWHSSCQEIGYEGDGEAVFPNSEHYTVKSSGVMTTGGKTRATRTTVTAEWLAADCGDIKPLDLKP